MNINDGLVNQLYYIKDVLDVDFIFKEKIIILATINYLYSDIDSSYEVHTDYILFKKLNNMDKGIKRRFCGVFILIIIILSQYIKYNFPFFYLFIFPSLLFLNFNTKICFL